MSQIEPYLFDYLGMVKLIKKTGLYFVDLSIEKQKIKA